MKKQVDLLDAIPSKRLFLSIIADYNLDLAICELVDNAFDLWVKDQKKQTLSIKIHLDIRQQTINIVDNAGGVKKSELKFIVGPGQTSNLPTDKVIGIFGVGTKRAVVALAQEIQITTRYHSDKTYSVEFEDEWLEEENWELPIYEVDSIKEGTTSIQLQRLRIELSEDRVARLKEYLEVTYARFLHSRKVNIKVNGEKLMPMEFENWAYPPKFKPRKYSTIVEMEHGGKVKVQVTAGLISESSPTGGEYGVYLYCNDRLIVRGLKTYSVGFTPGLAGKPHPSISLLRVIVSLYGEAQLMPWNSSKSAINPNHPIFVALRDWLIQIVKYYASLSRRLEGEWPQKVFKYTKGKIVRIKTRNLLEARKSYLPPLPKAKPRYKDIVISLNRDIAKEKPWIKGLYEAIIATDMIFKQQLDQKNRICLILLDSTLEIAFKEYLVNESGAKYVAARLLNLFNNRFQVHDEIKKYKRISTTTWNKINHYYRLRCELIHKRVTAGINDDEVHDFRGVVQSVLKKLFKLKFNI